MLLYHCNYGWPLVDKGTKIVWQGECVSRGSDMDDVIFNHQHDFRLPGPLEKHRGTGSRGFTT
jgi:hypothetical protein